MSSQSPRDEAESMHFRTLDEEEGHRVDEVVARHLGIGRRAVLRLMERVRINDRRVAKGLRLAAGDEVRLLPPPPAAQAAGVRVVRETTDLLVLDKPAGLPSVDLAGDPGATLAGWIRSHRPECAQVGARGECGLVQRLDTGTSGLILAARRPAVHAVLRAQLHRHEVDKEYLAIVVGQLREAVQVDRPIGRHVHSQRRFRIVPAGAAGVRYRSTPASTDCEPIRALADATLVRARTRTGARHQIRLHLASLGHPLVGDVLYGGPPITEGGFFLHASSIEWTSADGARESARSEPPPGWEARIGLPMA